jgi:alpha-N-arabinofuranosidase
MKRHLIQATGHADLIEDNAGNWWAVFLGYRQTHQYFHHLGRETFLAPVTWSDGWPLINNGAPIETLMSADIPGGAVQQQVVVYETDFKNGREHPWVHLRNPDESSVAFDDGGLSLTGNEYNLSDVANPAFMGFRQRDLYSEMEADMEFSPVANNDEAGGSIFYKYDAHLDVCVTREHNKLFLCYRKVVGDIVHIETRLPLRSVGLITFKVRSDKLKYYVSAVVEGNEVFLGEGLTRYVSTEAHELGFTGTFYALYASGNGKRSESAALFSRFLYKGLDGELQC